MTSRPILLVVLLACLGIIPLRAQDSTKTDTPEILWWLGGYGAASFNMHSASFGELPGFPSCCAEYGSVMSIGPAFGALAEFPFSSQWALQLRAGYAGLSGELTADEVIGNEPVLRDGPVPTEERVDVLVSHSLDASLSMAAFEPVASFSPLENFWIHGGARVGFLLSKTFEQAETLVSPDGYVFAGTGSAIRNQASGDIPEANALQIHGVLGVGYDLPLSPTVRLAPDVRYYIPFTSISSVDWSVANLQAGIALKVGITKPKEPTILRDTVYMRDTTVIARATAREPVTTLLTRNVTETVREEEDLIVYTTTIKESYQKEVPRLFDPQVSLALTTVNASGQPVPLEKIRVVETDVIESYPLLPYVFFSDSTADLAQTRMVRIDPEDASDFRTAELRRDQFDVYRNLLNIVGERMRQNPAATLQLDGHVADIGAEKGRKPLAKERADNVKNYLVMTFGIDPKRISVESHLLPTSPASNNIPDGQAENRRVEMVANPPSILEPVVFKDRDRRVSPEQITASPRVQSTDPIASYTFEVDQNGRRLFSSDGEGTPRSSTWDPNNEPRPNQDAPVTAKLTVQNDEGQKKSVQASVPVEFVTVENAKAFKEEGKLVERFSLIVFDYNSSALNPANQKIMQKVRERVTPESTVRIKGYADRTGNPEFNKELARRRCTEAKRMLGVPDSQVLLEPIGADQLIYDNDTPEGRSYSRTVTIEVETPIKD